MKHFFLLLITLFLSATQIHALPATSDSNGIPRSILRRGFWSFWDSVPTWFGIGPEENRVVDLGRMECESDPAWRKTGFCAKAGKAFPKDGGVMPNAMDPEYLPAIPNHFKSDFVPIDWNPPDSNPHDLDPFRPPSPGEVTGPNGPLAGGRANGPDGGGETAPGGPVSAIPPAVDYLLPGGEVYTAPPGTPSMWTEMERMNFYNNVCVTDALALVKEGPPRRAALLDQAGIDTCDEVEGELFDVSDEMEEAQELQEAAEAANDEAEGPNLEDNINDWMNNPGIGPGNMIPGNGIPGANTENPKVINDVNDWMDRPDHGAPSDLTTGEVVPGGYKHPEVVNDVNEWMDNPNFGQPGVRKPKVVDPVNSWMDHPEYDNPGEVSSPNIPNLNVINDIMMSGGLGTGSVASQDTLASINNGPRWKRTFRRTLRKFRQWSRRRNANGFFDPEATKHMNYAFGLENDPILKGPGPEDDATYVRPTAEEKLIQAMGSIANLPYVPLILPDGYSWVPAEVAEFGDNFEAVKRFAVMMGRDPLLKAVPAPEHVFKMSYGVVGKDYTTKLLGLYGFHGTMITPEIFSNFHWRTQDWLKYGKPKPGDCPWWFRDNFAKPTFKKLKKIFPRKTHRYWALAGIVAAVWGIIGGVHAHHEKHMEELKIDHQKWGEPMKEGYGPWIIKESPVTTTMDGTVQVSILTEYTKYSPFSTTELSPSEIEEMMGPMVTTTVAAANGEMTAIAGAAAVTIPAAAMTLAAPEYAGIFRPEPLTVNVPVTTTVVVEPSPTPEGPRLNYVPPNRLLELTVPLTPLEDPVEVDVTPAHLLALAQPAYTDPNFVVPTPRPRPTHKAHGAYVNGTYTNGTVAVSNSTDGETSLSANATSVHSHHGPKNNLTQLSSYSENKRPNIQKAPHNVTTLGPYGFPNGTSSLHDHGHGYSNDTYGSANGTYRYSNNGTYRYPNGTYGSLNGTRGYGNMTSKPHGKLRLLKGTAPWGGVVVPEFSDAVPVQDGVWMCSWVPSRL